MITNQKPLQLAPGCDAVDMSRPSQLIFAKDDMNAWQVGEPEDFCIRNLILPLKSTVSSAGCQGGSDLVYWHGCCILSMSHRSRVVKAGRQPYNQFGSCGQSIPFPNLLPESTKCSSGLCNSGINFIVKDNRSGKYAAYR